MKTSKTSTPRSHATNEDEQLLLDVDNLSVAYGSEIILDDVSFCVHAGEFIGLIGPNGAGKTTLLRALLGLQSPTNGSVQRSRATIGYVPQRGATYAGTVPVSVLEVVSLGIARPTRWFGRANHAAQTGNTTQTARAALRRVHMEDYANKRITELSGGQQQRVSIAKALAGNANILILDEPATGIDERSQDEFYALLTSLQQQGVTIIMVSHEVDTVLKLVTRVICLNRDLLYDGPPEHFEADEYLPRTYQQHHLRLHHRHNKQPEGGRHA